MFTLTALFRARPKLEDAWAETVVEDAETVPAGLDHMLEAAPEEQAN